MPVIGIVTRKYVSEEKHIIDIIYSDMQNAVIKNGGIPIGITLNSNYKKIIELCDGIIFQGGDDFEEFDFEVIKYLYEIDKPVLGICLGMQLIALSFGGTMIDIKNHKTKLKYSHKIKIKKESTLYNIFKNEVINVNSRHKSTVKGTSINISAISEDGVIEAIEAKDKKFFIGMQWHPESMIDYDDKQNKVFEYFIQICTT